MVDRENFIDETASKDTKKPENSDNINNTTGLTDITGISNGTDSAAEPDNGSNADKEDKEQLYKRLKFSYSIRLLCAVYMTYLIYSLVKGFPSAAGTERMIAGAAIVVFAVFDVWCYISAYRGFRKIKNK